MRFFHKSLCSFLATLVLAASCPWMAWGQEATSTIAGRVLNAKQEAVGGAKIVAKDASAKILREATSDAEGYYCLENLPKGQYQLTLDPRGSGFREDTAVATVGPEGLRVDWFISEHAKTMALATPGTVVCQPLAMERAIFGGVFLSSWLGSLIAAVLRPRPTSASQ